MHIVNKNFPTSICRTSMYYKYFIFVHKKRRMKNLRFLIELADLSQQFYVSMPFFTKKSLFFNKIDEF